MRYKLRNLSDIHIDLSSALKFQCNLRNGLSKHAFLLMFNSSVWPNSAYLRDIMLRHLSDLD